jgi:hypothetical protein
MEGLPIYELVISEDDNAETEVNFIALVKKPAIERNFIAFAAEDFIEPGSTETQDEFIGRCIPAMIGEGYEQDQAAAICYTKWEDRERMASEFQDSITDIPDDVRANARNAVEYAEKNGWGSCGTAVGKRRASQLADRGGAVSLDTVRRMYSYLSRHEGDLERSKGYSDGCGKLMYDAWGGKAGLRWSRSVLRREGVGKFAVQDEAQRIVQGALMIPGKRIYRRDEDTGSEYFVTFTAETIKAIALKFMRKRYQGNVNIMHDGGQIVPGAVLFETWLKDSTRGVGGMKGYEDLPDGTWFGSIKIEDEDTWAQVMDGKLQGFSVEGVFGYSKVEQEPEAAMMSQIIDILKQVGNN